MAASRRARVQTTLAALLLAAGSSYAGLKVGRNTVASPQVKNNSLTSADIHNGTLRSGDLSRGVLPELYSFQGLIAADGLDHQVLKLPGGASFVVGCNSVTTTEKVFLNLPVGSPAAYIRISGHDLFDNSPVGAAGTSTAGGGVGLIGNAIVWEGQLWLQTPDAVVHGDWSVTPPVAGQCRAMVQVTAKRLASPVPLPRPMGKASTCQASGSAWCRRGAS